MCRLLLVALALPFAAVPVAAAANEKSAPAPPPPPGEPQPPRPAPAAPPAAVAAPPAPGVVRAVRARSAPRIDGRLDDAVWADAPPFDAFVDNEPVEGKRPSERTELRVLFDDENLYLGFTCHDSDPGDIGRSLARRDSEPASDFVVAFVSPSGDRRTAHRFYLNAGGVQADSLVYDDVQTNQSWDAVWDGAAALAPDGWTAELAIPLHALGALDAARASWGFLARRYLARTHERAGTILIPRAANGLVSRFGALVGVGGIAPHGALEVTPYLAARSLLRPPASDVGGARAAAGAADVGVDAAWYLGHGLVLNATVNPDFGQVEPDQIVLNLSSFESFFPEKRPFFTQGLDLFEPVGGTGYQQLQSMFYSRRMGLDVPILAAAKLTGRPLPGLAIGVLDAVVDGARPLHLQAGSDADAVAPPGDGENFLAAVARVAVAGDSWIGARFSGATPLCRACPTPGVNAAGLDAMLETGGGDYAAFGQIAASQIVGGPAQRVQPDGTTLAPGDLGLGGYVRAGKLGGEGTRFLLGYEFASPHLDLNAIGFQRDANHHNLSAEIGYTRPNGLGPLLGLDATLHGDGTVSADGRGLRRLAALNASVHALLPGFHTLSFNGSLQAEFDDLRELRGSGVAMRSAAIQYMNLILDTDPNRILALHALAALGHHAAIGPTPARFDYTLEGGFVLRPSPAFQTQLTVTNDRTLYDPRFIESLGHDRFLLGRLDSEFLAVTLRQDITLTRRITLQAYLQLFTSFSAYGPYFEGSGTRARPLQPSDLTPAAMPATDPSFQTAQVLANVVGRWEYRPGSTIFLVYSRSQRETPPDRFAATLAAPGLLRGPAVDLVLVKWAHWLSL